MTATVSNKESAVKQRYTAAASAPEAALCCPVEYDARYLAIIPQEVIEKDYGCGDPSRHIRAGETILDLGSGAGKICFIAAQVVGPNGKVIGVDMNDAMIEVAQRNAPVVANQLGYANVEFRKGRIQDLALDLHKFEPAQTQPTTSPLDDYLANEDIAEHLRLNEPLVSTASIDVVVSNCVLNLVQPAAKRQLFREIYRVLRTGGRAVISDIVSDTAVPNSMQADPDLWSGCISGAMQEQEFLSAFENAGFNAVVVLQRQETPWRVVNGIEFRSVTIEARKSSPVPFQTQTVFQISNAPQTVCGTNCC